MTGWRARLVGVAVGATLLAGCTGGGEPASPETGADADPPASASAAGTDEPATATEPPTVDPTPTVTDPVKAEFLAAGNAICEQAVTEVTELQTELFDIDPESSEAVEDAVVAFLAGSAESFRGAIAELRQLEPPPGDEETLNAIYAEGERALGEIEALDPTTEELPSEEPLAEFNQRAADYGLTSCGGG